MAAAESLCASITPQLFSPAAPTRAFLLLGASPSAPREAWEFIFPPALCDLEYTLGTENVDQNTQSSSETTANGNAMQAQAASRRAERELLLTLADALPEAPAGSRRCKAHLLIQTAAQAPEEEFAVRRGWGLRMRRGVHITLSFLPREAAAAAEVAAAAAAAPVDPTLPAEQALGVEVETAAAVTDHAILPARLWLQSRHVLQGLVKPARSN